MFDWHGEIINCRVKLIGDRRGDGASLIYHSFHGRLKLKIMTKNASSEIFSSMGNSKTENRSKIFRVL